MKKTAIVMLAIALVAGISVAAEKNFEPKDKHCMLEKEPSATGPVGAVVETVGVFVGKIASTAEIACTGERKLTVENETGECRIFPFCATTKVADTTFNAATFDSLKAGEKVKVEYAEEGGVAKAKTVTVEK